MASYSFHRLIIGKAEIGCFCCRIGDFFSQICLLSSPPTASFILHLSKFLNLICCRGHLKGNFRRKKLKYLLLRNHKGDEAETWHICLEY